MALHAARVREARADAEWVPESLRWLLEPRREAHAGTMEVVVSRVTTDSELWTNMLYGSNFTVLTEGVDVEKRAEAEGMRGVRPADAEILAADRAQPYGRNIRTIANITKPMTHAGGSTRECGGYLAYIVKAYNHLPDVVAFMQGNPLRHIVVGANHEDWHTDPHVFMTLRAVARDTSKVDYCSLNRAYMDWTDKSSANGTWYVRELRRLLDYDPDGRYSELRRAVFPRLRDEGVACFCCAQFAVSRARIQAHPRAVYQQFLDFIMDDPLEEDVTSNNRCAIAERLWHVLLGEADRCSAARTSCRAVYAGTAQLSSVRYLS